MVWLYFPDTPIKDKFLNERERTIAIERLRDNRTGIRNTEFKKEQLKEALLDIKVWYGFVYAIACIVPSTSVANFGSLIKGTISIRNTFGRGTNSSLGLGFDTFQTSLLACPLGVVEDIALLITGCIAYNYANMRCLMQFFCNIPAVLGSVLVHRLPTSNRAGRLVSFSTTQCTNGSLPMMMALTTINIAGHTKRSVATSLMFVGYCVGFIIGPQFFLTSEGPVYSTGFKTMIILFAVSSLGPPGDLAYGPPVILPMRGMRTGRRKSSWNRVARQTFTLETKSFWI